MSSTFGMSGFGFFSKHEGNAMERVVFNTDVVIEEWYARWEDVGIGSRILSIKIMAERGDVLDMLCGGLLNGY